MTESHLPPNGEWKVGDVVEAFGVRGKITSISNFRVLTVLFDDLDDAWMDFCEDGKHYLWHRTLSLRFISREKKKVRNTVTAWANVFRDGSATIWVNQKDADVFSDENRIACVELKGEYEVEE